MSLGPGANLLTIFRAKSGAYMPGPYWSVSRVALAVTVEPLYPPVKLVCSHFAYAARMPAACGERQCAPIPSAIAQGL